MSENTTQAISLEEPPAPPAPKLSAEDIKRRAVYRTGFCSSGLCEGTRPKSPSGKPMKVCDFVDVCSCECHKKISKMYELAGVDRIVQQNPEYQPYLGPDLSWLQDERVPPAPVVPAQPFTLSAPNSVGESHTAGTMAVPDADRPSRDNRLRGWLEYEVKSITDRKMSGEIDETLTPKLLAILIDPEDPPSVGAVGAVLDRWVEIGFAQVNKHPVRFVSYTVKGMTLGLDRMKADAKQTKRSN